MQIRLTIAILFLFLTNLANGQIGLTVSSGVSISEVIFENQTVDIEADKFHGYYLEAALDYQPITWLRLCLNNQFDVRGYESTGSNRIKYRRMYVDIIPTVTLVITKNVEAGIGMYYGILINESFKGVKNEYTDITNLQTIKSKDRGVVFGLALYYKRLGLKANYKYGNANIENGATFSINGVFAGELYQYSREIQLGISYRIFE